MVASTAHCMVFNCRYYDNNWYLLGNAYTCTPTLSETNYESTLTSVTGNHLSGRTNADLTGLNFWQIEINRLLKKIETFFPNIKRIHFQNSNMQSITADDLKPFPLLEYFYTSEKCKLFSIDGDLFKNNPKLQLVAFSHTFIEHFGFNLLTNLKELREAKFHKNLCADIVAKTPQAIQELSLHLSTNCPPLKIECPETCVKRIESTDTEVATLKGSLAQYGERIVELEKQIRELSARS